MVGLGHGGQATAGPTPVPCAAGPGPDRSAHPRPCSGEPDRPRPHRPGDIDGATKLAVGKAADALRGGSLT